MERTCDGCTACCKTHNVAAVDKMAGEWCSHCNKGKGCAIYVSRPAECQHFKCSWLLGVGNPEHRPDKIGIVSEYKEMSVGPALWLFEVSVGRLNSSIVKTWTLNNLWVGNCVLHIPCVGNPKLYLSAKGNKVDSSFVLAGGENQRKIEIISFENSLVHLG